MTEDNVTIEKVEGKTEEEKSDLWVNWIKKETMAVLDLYLPNAKNGDIGIKYEPLVISDGDSGTVTDETKAEGVLVFLKLKFETPIDLTKPRT